MWTPRPTWPSWRTPRTSSQPRRGRTPPAWPARTASRPARRASPGRYLQAAPTSSPLRSSASCATIAGRAERRYPVASLVAAALWRARPDLIVALDDRFGEPVDALRQRIAGVAPGRRAGRDGVGVAFAPRRPLPAADRAPAPTRSSRPRPWPWRPGNGARPLSPSCGMAWRPLLPTARSWSHDRWRWRQRPRSESNPTPRAWLTTNRSRRSGNEPAVRSRSSPICSVS